MRIFPSPHTTLIEATSSEFHDAKVALARSLQSGIPINRGKWQSEDTTVAAYELHNVLFSYRMPQTFGALVENVPADVEWAEEHFRERVGGEPLNPAPSYVRWPYHSQKEAERHVANGVFSHTYPERMWPTFANVGERRPNGRRVYVPHNGIRYQYGNLQDVVTQLQKDPFTRQAYLPIWFPEDTGATEGQRVPCTLGYHFIRNGQHLDCNYFIRSCDIYRHFTNDVYLAIRLTEWIHQQLVPQTSEEHPFWLGRLNMFISNLHMFVADEWRFTT